MNQQQEEKWDLVIEPQSSLFNLNLRAVWNYRDLLLLLVKRDFVSFYKQTVLGPLWFFIQPLFTTIVFTFIFGNLAGLAPSDIPAPLFYIVGITAWNYFADCLTKTSTVFKDNAGIFGKVYFPRLIMPLSIVTSNLVRFGVQMILMLLMMAYFYFVKDSHFHVTWTIFLFPVLTLMMALLGLGLGLIITALTTKYRDLAFLITFGVQLLMYATTVIYPLSKIPEKYRYIIELNPMTNIIEGFRYAFLGIGEFTLNGFVYTLVCTIVFLLLGVIIFNKTEKTFVDTI